MSEHKMSFGSAIANAIRLRCPRCGKGKLYDGFITMSKECSNCQLDIAKKPGYYLGSTYINYGFTTVISMVTYMTLRFGYDIESKTLIPYFVTFLVAFPLLFFRHARSLWLAMDTLIDRPE
ncbi:MAG: DUF983 domain-containing protein [Planctomycetaceae bacterium]